MPFFVLFPVDLFKENVKHCADASMSYEENPLMSTLLVAGL